MIRVLLFALVSLGWMGATAGPAAAQQPPGPFQWNSFGGDHRYPRWKEIPGNATEVNLDSAQGTLTLSRGQPRPGGGLGATAVPKKARLKIFKPGVIVDTWQTTPEYNVEIDPGLMTEGPDRVSWLFTWADDAVPKKKFPRGQRVRVEVELTIQAADGSTTTSSVQPTFPSTDPH